MNKHRCKFVKLLNNLILISIICLVFIPYTSAELFQSDIIITSPDGIWTDSRAYSTLNAAIAAIGIKDREIIIASPQTVTDLTIPSNARLKFLRNGSITNSGYLNIQTSNISADNRQIFTGTGNIDFIPGSVIKSGWFSNLESAFALTVDDIVTLIISKPYILTSSYSPGDDVNLKWESPGNTITAPIGVTVDNISSIESGNFQLFIGDGHFHFTDGIVLNLSWFPRLRAAVAWIDTTSATIEVTKPSRIDYSDIINTNIHINVKHGGLLVLDPGIILTINSSFEAGDYQAFSGNGAVDLSDSNINEVLLRWWGVVGDGITDVSNAINAAIQSTDGGTISFGSGLFRITETILIDNTGSRGAYILKGVGSTYHSNSTPTTDKGTTLIWDGSVDDIMFDMGSPSPIYIAGVLQTIDNAQFNNQIMDMSILFHAGVESVFYVHDQDGFQAYRMYIDGHNEKAIRGVFDFRGAVNNIRLDQVTISNIPNGYGIRNGDGSTNSLYNQVFIGNVGLGVWIGDTEIFEDPYQNSSFTFSNGTFEGFFGNGKFEVTTLDGNVIAGIYVVDVAAGDGLLFAVDDPVFIDKGSDKFEMNKVESINVDEITLTYPLDYSHLDGAIIKAGDIGIHLGHSSPGTGRTTNIIIDRVMWDRYGCCIDVHNTDVISIRDPIFISRLQRGLFIDGDTQNIDLYNPKVLSSQLATWRLFEITNRGNVYNFNWWGGADHGGVAQPYINSQGDIDGMYLGSLQQVAGDLPDNFRGIFFDSSGIQLIEEDAGTAAGLDYSVGGTSIFNISSAGTVTSIGGSLVIDDSIDNRQGKYYGVDTSEPAAPVATENVLFFERWGGKGHFYIKFPTGAKVLIATEP